MKILGLDTSLDRLSLAVIEEDKILAEFDRDAKGILAEILIDSIDNVLGNAGVALSGLSGLAVSIGPGSFTGLRVGLATVKGIVWSSALPLVAIPTFEVLAYQSKEESKPVAVITQAREGLIFGAVYSFVTGLPIRQGEFFTTDLEKLGHRIPLHVGVIRSGESPGLEQLKKSLPERQILINHEVTVPRGSSVALLGLEKLKLGQTVEPQDAEPIYLQKAIYRSKFRDEWISYPPDDRS